MVEGKLDRGQVFIESVKPRDAESRAHLRYIHMRSTFGVGGPLPVFFGIRWHLLKRKRNTGAQPSFTGASCC